MPRTRDAVPAPTEYPLQVLREYSLLADGERGVLVGPRGDFAWMCMPTWNSDAVFSSLLDGPGMYGPSGHDYTAHGSFDARSHSRSLQLWASQNHGLLAAGGALGTTLAFAGVRRFFGGDH